MKINREEWLPSEGINFPQIVLNDIIKNNSNLAIIAGPGTGKTELLAQKAAYLFETNECPNPYKIIALCFKVDAAKNLQERIEKRCCGINNRFISLTFDAFFISIVRKYGNFLPNWISTFSSDFEVGNYNYDSSIKNIYDFNMLNDTLIQKKLNDYLRLKKLHWDICRKLAFTIIKNSKEVRRLISSTYKYVFIDEFQDTTSIQYAFIKELFNNDYNLVTVVGDYNQMIMRWAGADSEIFNKFAVDFNTKPKFLNINHRSNKHIVNLINFISEQITPEGQEPIKFIATRGDEHEQCILAAEFNTKQEEITKIASYISEQIETNNMEPDDFSLILRQKAGDFFILGEKIFRANNLFLRNEDALACEDGIAIQTLMGEPLSEFFINLLKKKIGKINYEENKRLCNTLAFLKNYDLNNEKKYKKLICDLNSILSLIDDYTRTSSWTNKIIKEIGINNIKKIVKLSSETDYVKIKISFDAFFQECYNGTQDVKKAISKYIGENQVKLMTIHKSKGLEFHTVFFVDFNTDSWWGLSNAINNNNLLKLSEEQNAFFVGASRAKEKLIFTNGKKSKWPPVITKILNDSHMINIFE